MTTSVSNAPSIDIKEMLIYSGSPVDLTFGTDLFIATFPDKPDDAVCIYDTGGRGQGEFGFEYPTVQIIVRNMSYIIGYDLARDIKYWLHLSRNNEIWGGTRYIDIQCRAEIIFLGQDEKKRFQWSINFQAWRSGI